MVRSILLGARTAPFLRVVAAEASDLPNRCLAAPRFHLRNCERGAAMRLYEFFALLASENLLQQTDHLGTIRFHIRSAPELCFRQFPRNRDTICALTRQSF